MKTAMTMMMETTATVTITTDPHVIRDSHSGGD